MWFPCRDHPIHPDFTAMHFHNPPHQRQADAAALRVGIEFFEQTKNFPLMPRVNSDAVVTDKKHPFITFRFHSDLHQRRRLIPHELDRVVHQVLEDFNQPRTVSVKQGRFLRYLDLYTPRRDLPGHQVQSIFHDGL